MEFIGIFNLTKIKPQLCKTKVHGNMNTDRSFPKEKRKDDSAFFKTSLEICENISSWKELEI